MILKFKILCPCGNIERVRFKYMALLPRKKVKLKISELKMREMRGEVGREKKKLNMSIRVCALPSVPSG